MCCVAWLILALVFLCNPERRANCYDRSVVASKNLTELVLCFRRLCFRWYEYGLSSVGGENWWSQKPTVYPVLQCEWLRYKGSALYLDGEIILHIAPKILQINC